MRSYRQSDWQRGRSHFRYHGSIWPIGKFADLSLWNPYALVVHEPVGSGSTTLTGIAQAK
jgi:hypothetical protein